MCIHLRINHLFAILLLVWKLGCGYFILDKIQPNNCKFLLISQCMFAESNILCIPKLCGSVLLIIVENQKQGKGHIKNNFNLTSSFFLKFREKRILPLITFYWHFFGIQLFWINIEIIRNYENLKSNEFWSKTRNLIQYSRN